MLWLTTVPPQASLIYQNFLLGGRKRKRGPFEAISVNMSSLKRKEGMESLEMSERTQESEAADIGEDGEDGVATPFPPHRPLMATVAAAPFAVPERPSNSTFPAPVLSSSANQSISQSVDSAAEKKSKRSPVK